MVSLVNIKQKLSLYIQINWKASKKDEVTAELYLKLISKYFNVDETVIAISSVQ